jgi:hypothetical protein
MGKGRVKAGSSALPPEKRGPGYPSLLFSGIMKTFFPHPGRFLKAAGSPSKETDFTPWAHP